MSRPMSRPTYDGFAFCSKNRFDISIGDHRQHRQHDAET